MSDDMAALIAEARTEADRWPDGSWQHDLTERLADALEVSVQATAAVDHAQLAKVIVSADRQWYDNSAKSRGWTVAAWSKHLARAILASGVLQDAAEVEARGLEWAEQIVEDTARQGGGLQTAAAAIHREADRLSAQQVREGKA